jgi:transketolase
VVRSVIGWGSPRAGSAKAHGEPLGEDGVRATKEAYGWPQDKSSTCPMA